ncbi:hypothetical protein [Methylobacterium iners]|uniref:Uncharacterized protein n=1 Tax=Methylobacterium iners TaxID=418707 RepID=A0ABQ4RT58_9HYPH|nr:hypothetical protein [Methylobacterium iners]GJD93343.1 hypothetical protein OCOJLMKI_0536 [Methylobacterium iners]
MTTVVEALVEATAAMNAATASVLQARTQIQADFAAAKADAVKVVNDVTVLQRQWYCDPVNGNDANDGSTLAKATKTLHGIVSRAPSATKHYVFLMNDITHEHWSQAFADISVRGSQPGPDPAGVFPVAAAQRKVTFRPTALNSPIGNSQTTTAMFQLFNTMSFTGVDLVLADQPAGQTISGHFYAFRGANLIVDIGSILGVTAGAPGRLIQKGDSAPVGFYLYGSVAAAAQGRIFSGIAAGADPRVGGFYQTNLTTN